MRLRARANRARDGAGFTLVELILVIVIILILAAIAIPAYASLTYSSNQSGASNAVQAALQSTRDAAVRAGSGRDAAAVFLIGDDGRMRIVVAEVAGTIEDSASGSSGPTVLRDIFVPADGVEVFVLPRNWTVRGYARPASLQTTSLGGAGAGATALADNRGWYEDTYTGGDRALGQWVFPETAYYDDSAGNSGQARQSFMVRFEGGSGRFLSSATSKALFLDPAPTLSFRDPGTAPWSTYRVDREPDLGRFVRKVLADPTLSVAQRRQLLGDEATDTVLVGPVGQLAVYNEKRLANAIGADGVNRFTDTLYKPVAGTVNGPEYDDGLFGSISNAEINLRISLWMRASDLQAGALPAADTSDARIFLVSRYLGQPIEAARLAEGR